MIYLCCDEHRREAVRQQRTLNGIDFLEVLDDPSLPPSAINGHVASRSIGGGRDQSAPTLLVHFIHPLKTDALDKEHMRIEGGERIRDVSVIDVAVGDSSKVLTVWVNKPGDFSIYTLRLLPDPERLKLDPLLTTIDFTFKIPGPDNLDCKVEQVCPPELQPAPEINYLAKDYSSFRQLMLDRLSVLMPQWKERSPADIGVMLVEVLAYVGDHLSYQQDVIATESYLGTARRRISVRRHARLLDYFMGEGSNARMWVQVQVNQDMVKPPDADDSVPAPLPKGTRLLTKVVGQDDVLLPDGSLAYQQALLAQSEVFETLYDVNGLFQAHNELHFYTWGSRECCLPKGATSATLQGSLTNLQPGDVLIFKEVLGSHTGAPEDAEPAHRHAVRLTSVALKKDPLGAWFTQPSTDQPGKKDSEADKGKIEVEVRIKEEDRRVEGVAIEEKGRIVQAERTVEETRTAEEKRTVEDSHVVEDQTKEEDQVVEKEQIEEEDNGEDTQELPIIRFEMQTGDPTDKGRSARKKDNPAAKGKNGGKKDKGKRTRKKDQAEDNREIVEEEHTVDVEETRTVEEELDLEGGKIREEERMVDETRVVEEERIVRTVGAAQEPDYSIDITDIEWHYEDALPFPLCISTTTGYQQGHRYLENVSVALGNIVLADHGQTVGEEDFATVPQSAINLVPMVRSGNRCEEQRPVSVPPRFYPSLKYGPLTYAVPYDPQSEPASASATMLVSAHDAVPAIALRSTEKSDNVPSSGTSGGATNGAPTAKKGDADVGARDLKRAPQASLRAPTTTQDTDTGANGGMEMGAINRAPTTWQAKRDLLDSDPTDRNFVIEIEANGTTYLRFGDGQYGLRPRSGTSFTATYRVGNGVRGNVGAEALAHIVSSDTRITGVYTPLPALGGIDPESIEDVRQKAPSAFNMQERGVTPDDYKGIAERDPEVRQANAVLRWTGSWYTVYLVVEHVGGMPVDDTFKDKLRQRMERFRMAGADLEIVAPVYVSLEIAMNVRVKANYFRSNVRATLLEIFSNRQWPDGQRGIFYPDNYTFGQPVYLNPLLAAASAVPGVDAVEITAFQRQGIPGHGLDEGMLAMDWLEIARLDNDPNYPEHGILRLNVEGGK